MGNYMDDTSDISVATRERAFLHAGRLLALHLDDGYEVHDLPAFDPDRPTTANTVGPPIVTALGYLVAATSYEVDLAIHFGWKETADDPLRDHLAYVRAGGGNNDAPERSFESDHAGGGNNDAPERSFESDHAGDAYLDDEAWVERTYEQIMLRHYNALDCLAEALLDDPYLHPADIEAMLRVTGPCIWATHLVEHRPHDDDECPTCGRPGR